MIIEKKEKYTLITANENSFNEFLESFENEKTALKKEAVFLQFSENINTTTNHFSLFLNTAKEAKKNGTTFVIISPEVEIDNVSEELNIAPTLIEAEDILEMENIERALGF